MHLWHLRLKNVNLWGMEQLGYQIRKPVRGIYSETHALAKEVSEYCGEPKKFAMYLGVIESIGLRAAYRIFSQIKQGKDVVTPGKLFLYMSKFEPKIRKRRAKKRKQKKKSKRSKNGNRQRAKQDTTSQA